MIPIRIKDQESLACVGGSDHSGRGDDFPSDFHRIRFNSLPFSSDFVKRSEPVWVTHGGGEGGGSEGVTVSFRTRAAALSPAFSVSQPS